MPIPTTFRNAVLVVDGVSYPLENVRVRQQNVGFQSNLLTVGPQFVVTESLSIECELLPPTTIDPRTATLRSAFSAGVSAVDGLDGLSGRTLLGRDVPNTSVKEEVDAAFAAHAVNKKRRAEPPLKSAIDQILEDEESV